MAVIGLGAPRANAVGEIWPRGFGSVARPTPLIVSRRGAVYHVPCPALPHLAATDPVMWARGLARKRAASRSSTRSRPSRLFGNDRLRRLHVRPVDPRRVHSVNALQLSVQIEVRLGFPWLTHPPWLGRRSRPPWPPSSGDARRSGGPFGDLLQIRVV